MRVLVIAPWLAALAEAAAASDGTHAASDGTLRDHFAILRASNAHERRATPLPASAAAAVLHLDLSLYADDGAEAGAHEAAFGAMLKQSAADLVSTSATSAAGGKKAPHVVCDPQSHAKATRASLAAATGDGAKKRGGFDVAFASGEDGVACWTALLDAAGAEKVANSNGVFHVSPVPPAAKLAPNLVVAAAAASASSAAAAGTTRLAPAAGAIKSPGTALDRSGAKVVAYFDPSVAVAAAAGGAAGRAAAHASLEALVGTWRAANFGLSSSSSSAGGAAAKAHFSSGKGWKAVHAAATSSSPADEGCGAVLDVSVASDSLRGARLTFTRTHASAAALASSGSDERADACCLAALAFVAAQPEVRSVELQEQPTTQAAAPKTAHAAKGRAAGVAKPMVPAAEARAASAAEGGSTPPPRAHRQLNFMAVHALQSGDADTTPPLWAAGVTGAGQFVHVSDTGFDDASCFLRTDGSAAGLTGDFNARFQVCVFLLLLLLLETNSHARANVRGNAPSASYPHFFQIFMNT
jgi:hypothetical protein